MKKFYMTMVAMLCGVAAMAQTENRVYVNDVKIDKGTTEFGLPVSLSNNVEVAAISFRLELPEGFVVKTNARGKASLVLGARADGWTAANQEATDGNQMISVYDNYPFDGNDGEIVTVPVTATEEAVAGDAEYTIRLYEIAVSDPDNVSLTVSGVFPEKETTFKLTVGEGTGINSINAEDSKAPVYNVAGQRVSKAQKGVYIQNGKKVAVK